MEQNKQKKFFSLKNDSAFTQVMKKEKVLQGFLSAVLGIPVEDILSVEVKDRYLDRNSPEEKYGILDVRATVVQIGDFNIELQLNKFHVIELKKLGQSIPTEKDINLYNWAKLINAEKEKDLKN